MRLMGEFQCSRVHKHPLKERVFFGEERVSALGVLDSQSDRTDGDIVSDEPLNFFNSYFPVGKLSTPTIQTSVEGIENDSWVLEFFARSQTN